jgi:hypothetical protein
MKHIPTSVVAVVCPLTWALPALTQDVASQIVGVWKIKSVESLDVESKEVRRPFGDNPQSFFAFSKGGRFLKGNSCGNYQVEGSKVMITYDRSTTMQDIAETTLVREVEVKGNVMTLKSTPVVNRMNGKTVVFTLVAERVD